MAAKSMAGKKGAAKKAATKSKPAKAGAGKTGGAKKKATAAAVVTPTVNSFLRDWESGFGPMGARREGDFHVSATTNIRKVTIVHDPSTEVFHGLTSSEMNPNMDVITFIRRVTDQTFILYKGRLTMSSRQPPEPKPGLQDLINGRAITFRGDGTLVSALTDEEWVAKRPPTPTLLDGARGGKKSAKK